MSAKYVKIKGKQISPDSIDTSKVKNRTITKEDIALGTFTGEIFADKSIDAIKLSDDVTKQGNVFNQANRLLKLNSNGKVPSELLNISEILNNSNIDFLINPSIVVKYVSPGVINLNEINLKKIYLIRENNNNVQVKQNAAAIFYNESDGNIYIKTETGTRIISDNIKFVSKEIPQGEINGINTMFTLSKTPILNSERVYINGLREKNYIINNNVIIFSEPPFVGSEIIVDYAYFI